MSNDSNVKPESNSLAKFTFLANKADSEPHFGKCNTYNKYFKKALIVYLTFTETY